jgi:rubrerythrin
MTDRSQIDILKGALLLEHKGRALYSSVAETTGIEAVKNLFFTLVEEENKHVDFLSKQYSRLANGQPFDVKDLPDRSEAADHAFTGGLAEKVSGAGYEAAVISAALEFEKNAVRYYSEQASSASDAGEKDLYAWLAKWETSHLQMLAEIDRELREKIWSDNRFWPLD